MPSPSSLLLLALGCCLAAPGSAQPCPAGIPPGLSAVPVASNVASAGLGLDIRQVQGKEDLATILDRTEQQWRAAGHAVRRDATAGWQVLSALGGDCLVTLQLVPQGSKGSFGYLSRGRKATASLRAVTPAALGVPLPPGAALASSVASNDDGRRGVTMALHSRMPVPQLRQFYMQQLAAGGWRATRAHDIDDRQRGAGMTFITAQRDRRQISIVIWPDGPSQIILTAVEAL
ncbi:UNVERIFIED_ORG: hypothetical protein JN05_04501 [Zoogloea ramigera]|uniref:Uncharacterized protein n=1 Tax=Duganella zoogloeoides TaxID=75659 RepID=A0ABZ0XZY7_9BURK|nr:hypothetical protein [Duganella zoogloeoides]WQH04670.1 hypothetical protein SR858_27130 [Duganella zoogloeoides]